MSKAIRSGAQVIGKFRQLYKNFFLHGIFLGEPKISKRQGVFVDLGAVVTILGLHDGKFLCELLGCEMGDLTKGNDHKGRLMAGDDKTRANKILDQLKAALAEIKRSES